MPMARRLWLPLFALTLLLGTASPGGAQEIPVTFVKVAEVVRLLRGGTRVALLDVRTREEFDARRIKGAVSMPLSQLEARLGEIPRQGLVVLY